MIDNKIIHQIAGEIPTLWWGQNYFFKASLTYHIAMCQVPLISLDSAEPGRASKQDSYQELPNIVKRTFQGTFPKTFPSLSVRRTTDQENQVTIIDNICLPHSDISYLVLQNKYYNWYFFQWIFSWYLDLEIATFTFSFIFLHQKKLQSRDAIRLRIAFIRSIMCWWCTFLHKGTQINLIIATSIEDWRLIQL